MPTLKQERLAAALENPEHKTKVSAMIAAGYSESTALKKAKRQTELVGTRNVREKIRQETGLSNRDLANRAQKVLVNRLETGEATDGLVISTYKTAHELVIQGADAGQSEDLREAVQGYRDRLRRALRRAYRAGFLAAGGRLPDDLPNAQPGSNPPPDGESGPGSSRKLDMTPMSDNT